MVHLVHITSENRARRIKRAGIAATRLPRALDQRGEHDRVVWAFPVLASHTLTHSWSRELKRWGRTALAAVTFRISGEEPVYVRHYLLAPRPATAAEAAGAIRAAADPRGYEIMVPRRIAAAEIVRIRALSAAVGWRYFPEAKGRPLSLCDCPACVPRGEVKARRFRERLAQAREQAAHSAGRRTG